MLHARPVVELQILLDLRLPPPLRRLIQGEFHPPVAVRHHLRHQRRVLGRDVFIVEVLIERKTHHGRVKVYPAVHLIPAHIADYVVNMQQACGAGQVVFPLGNVSGQKRPMVILALDKGVDRISINGDGGHLCASMFVLDLVRLLHAARPSPRGLFPCQRASSTHSATSRTPSPCRRMCSATSLSGRKGVVSTKRILPCCKT